jgi:predicted nuclease of predicted toxin-antitoxin system
MKIKLDENLPADIVELIASYHHDVDTVEGESLVGLPDEAVFRAAIDEGRILFTQDLDFSDIRKFQPGTHPGLVLIRMRDPSRRRIIERLRQILKSESIDAWAGCFVVIARDETARAFLAEIGLELNSVDGKKKAGARRNTGLQCAEAMPHAAAAFAGRERLPGHKDRRPTAVTELSAASRFIHECFIGPHLV